MFILSPQSADHIFWCGDLNYRVDFGNPDRTGNPYEFERVVKLATQSITDGMLSLEPLIAGDQLKREMSAHRVFCGFEEAPVLFRPTYRMEKGRDAYNNKKFQNPSWTDRILYKSAAGLKADVAVLNYTGVYDIWVSDHRPGIYLFHWII